METYSLLREIADSWVLLAMFLFFVGAIIWAFRPGSTRVYDDVSRIPLRDEIDVAEAPSCSGQCASCACVAPQTALKGLQNV
ncbi:MAG: cbb3-type cytochrome c oxidase subunit 3 [Pikeienuella sp.]